MSKVLPNLYHITYTNGDDVLKFADISAWSLSVAFSILKWRVGQHITFCSATCDGYIFNRLY